MTAELWFQIISIIIIGTICFALIWTIVTTPSLPSRDDTRQEWRDHDRRGLEDEDEYDCIFCGEIVSSDKLTPGYKSLDAICSKCEQNNYDNNK